MADRTLLLWSKMYEKAISDELWDCDRVIEVPENVTMENYEQVASKLSPVIFEEISKAKASDQRLRIVLLTGQGFSAIMMKVLENHLVPNGGELLTVKIAKKKPDSPTVVIDDAAAAEALLHEGIVDFDSEPLSDNTIFQDDLPNTLQPPDGWVEGEHRVK